jgi:tetratricopeptide (TPR) repeat protein
MSIPSNHHDFEQSALPRARWFGDLDDVEFEIQFYERLLERIPNEVNILRVLAELLTRKGQHRRILEIDRHLVALCPTDEVARYNLACSLAKQGFPHLAVQELAQSLTLGYNDYEHLEVDPDLDNVRDLEEFKSLLQQYRVEER